MPRMRPRRTFRLPASIPPFFLGLLGIVILLQQTFGASQDRPYLIGAGLTLLGVPVFWNTGPDTEPAPPLPPQAPASSTGEKP